MCGIVGLFLKKDDLRPKLGDMLTDMLITMTDRGPDSAGIAIYGDAAEGSTKITVQSKAPETEFDGLDRDRERYAVRMIERVLTAVDENPDNVLDQDDVDYLVRKIDQLQGPQAIAC